MCEVSAKILNCGVFGARHSFQIFRRNTWFLEDNWSLSKLLYGILHYLISIIKLQQNESIKRQFYINLANHLQNNHKYDQEFGKLKKRIPSHVYFKDFFFIDNSFLNCTFFRRYFSRILLIDSELPTLQMDFFEVVFQKFYW